jgi:hypothetical protein
MHKIFMLSDITSCVFRHKTEDIKQLDIKHEYEYTLIGDDFRIIDNLFENSREYALNKLYIIHYERY